MEPVSDYETCKTCDGSGERAYGDTTCGRGGAGGQMITVGPCNYCHGLGTIPTVETFRKAVSQFIDRHGEKGTRALADQFSTVLSSFLGDAEPHQTLRRAVMHWMIVYMEKAA